MKHMYGGKKKDGKEKGKKKTEMASDCEKEVKKMGPSGRICKSACTVHRGPDCALL